MKCAFSKRLFNDLFAFQVSEERLLERLRLPGKACRCFKHFAVHNTSQTRLGGSRVTKPLVMCGSDRVTKHAEFETNERERNQSPISRLDTRWWRLLPTVIGKTSMGPNRHGPADRFRRDHHVSSNTPRHDRPRPVRARRRPRRAVTRPPGCTRSLQAR